MKKFCPIEGCRREIQRSRVMCAKHWYQVSPELRAKIWRLYRTAALSAAHLKAVTEAIKQVNRLQKGADRGNT